MSFNTAVAAARVARVLGIKTIFQDLRGGATIYLPPRIAVVANGNTAKTFASDALVLTSGAGEAASVYGFGSPIHTIVQQLLPVFGDGVGSVPITIYPLVDGTTPAAGNILPVGVPTADFVAVVKLGGKVSQNIAIPATTAVVAMSALIKAGIDATLDMPCTTVDSGAAGVDLTAKWGGESGNEVTIEVEGGAAAGTTFTLTPMATGAGNPDVTTPLTLFGNVWENLIINGLTWGDTTNLDIYKVFGEGRWGALIHAPAIVFTGTAESDLGVLTTAGNLRKSDRVNSTISVPAAPDMPWQYAARAVARIAQTMGTNPARDYPRLDLSGLRPGPLVSQFDVDQRDLAVLAGISTVEVTAGVFELSDTVTYYHPDTEPVPGYRYVVDIVKLMNAIFNYRIEFNTSKWDGAPLVADEDSTANPDAKKPKDFRGAMATITDNLVSDALATKAKEIKASIDAQITGPKRVDLKVTHIISGNVGIISFELNFGFNFG